MFPEIIKNCSCGMLVTLTEEDCSTWANVACPHCGSPIEVPDIDDVWRLQETMSERIAFGMPPFVGARV